MSHYIVPLEQFVHVGSFLQGEGGVWCKAPGIWELISSLSSPLSSLPKTCTTSVSCPIFRAGEISSLAVLDETQCGDVSRFLHSHRAEVSAACGTSQYSCCHLVMADPMSGCIVVFTHRTPGRIPAMCFAWHVTHLLLYLITALIGINGCT